MLSLQHPTRPHRHVTGFTLVEVMVAMVIGMLGIIIMMQMYSQFEGQKRTTTSGDEAQNSGAISLFGIQQNIHQAGYCFSATKPTLGTLTLNPVMIDQPAALAVSSVRDTNTNTLLISYGNDACPPESGSGVIAATNTTMNVTAYAVRGGNLWQCDYLSNGPAAPIYNDCSIPANWIQIAGDVVSLKAECNAGQAIRVALVTRNHQLDKSIVTSTVNTPTWSGASPINLTLTNVENGFTWQNYRYKTFETLAPIRNSIWTGASGC